MSFYKDHVLPRLIELGCGQAALEPARAALLRQASGTVLEIGFGSGLNLPFLPPAVERVLAVDPSLGARALGRKRIAAARCPVEPIGLDAQGIGADDASADCALSTFTLCTIPDAAAALHEVRRVLRPGGTLLFLEHGRAPDAGVARWQARLNPLQRTLCGGCNLNRDIPALVSATGYTLQSLEAAYLPGIPRTHAFLYTGVAVANPS